MPPPEVIDALGEILRRRTHGFVSENRRREPPPWVDIIQDSKLRWLKEAEAFARMADERGLAIVMKDDGK